jgi:predicted AAA+ superfamily ATPase
MGKKLCKIVQTIQDLVTETNTFGFSQQAAPPSKQWRKTDPIMVDFDKDIVSRSRDEEKKKIMKILLDEASSKDLTVLPIFGMGGMGKTTFVQLIYNDPAIKKHFELRRCCVSDDFDAATIANSLCQTNTNENKGREKALQDLQTLISGKRYLIVLDDVWDPDDDKWGKLRSFLKQGGKVSSVLTTTPNAEIARRMSMGVAQAHNIE